MPSDAAIKASDQRCQICGSSFVYTFCAGHEAPCNLQLKVRPSTTWINDYVNGISLSAQQMYPTNALSPYGIFRDSLHLPNLPVPLGNQKQFSRRFSSFQIPMGLLRVPQGIEMLDAQL